MPIKCTKCAYKHPIHPVQGLALSKSLKDNNDVVFQSLLDSREHGDLKKWRNKRSKESRKQEVMGY